MNATKRKLKPNTRVFCHRCWLKYDNVGIKLKKKRCKYKSDCELCGYHEGYEYIEE